jgi:translation initiation factor 2B subunit (eIF-2B alpha/beta/delta family)
VMDLGYQIGAVIATDGREAFAYMVEQVAQKIRNGEISCTVDTIDNVITVFKEKDSEDDTGEVIEHLEKYKEKLRDELERAQQPHISRDTLLRMNRGVVEC